MSTPATTTEAARTQAQPTSDAPSQTQADAPSLSNALLQRKIQRRLVQRKEAAGEKKAQAPVFVEFTPKGEWDAADVDATLESIVAVPADLKAAILAGPKATAKYCVDLRARVTAGAPPSEADKISAALTSRVTELVYATSQSPMQYSQLADVARWAAQYPAAGADKAGPSKEKDKDAKPEEAGGKHSSAAETFATKLASQAGGRVRNGDKDVIRQGSDQANDAHAGEESGDESLKGWSFLRDPFDNTVTAVRPDGTGLQFTYQVEKGEGDPKVTLIRTVELSVLRVNALKRMDKMAPQEKQESEQGRKDRIAADDNKFAEAVAKYAKEHPSEAADYDARMKAWREAGAKPKDAPKAPAGYPARRSTTMCTDTPGTVYHAAGGNKKDGFPFTPPKDWPTFRTLAEHPEGPRPGDVYWLYDIDLSRTAHMGVFKSRTPVPGSDHHETWVVTDGGQGGYDKIQLAQERTRGPFNTKTGIFSSSIAEAGQKKGDRRLDGWVDIDAYFAQNAAASK